MSAGAQPIALDLDGRPVVVVVRRHPRARRLAVRVEPSSGRVVASAPRSASLGEVLDFVRAHAAWVGRRLDSLPAPVPFADGARVPLLGVEHPIRYRADRPGVVWLEDGEIHVAGRPEHLARRVRDWLVAEAGREARPRAEAKAAALGRTLGRVRMRDMRSRWGSCSARGDLSLCWRLVMAPEPVLDYVVAHEVAHLVERNHGSAFQAIVTGLADDVAGARAWLRRHGETLHRYGVEPVACPG